MRVWSRTVTLSITEKNSRLKLKLFKWLEDMCKLTNSEEGCIKHNDIPQKNNHDSQKMGAPIRISNRVLMLFVYKLNISISLERNVFDWVNLLVP